jgi:hypothetical protein
MQVERVFGMTIEVKQLLVKSTVLQKCDSGEQQTDLLNDFEELKHEIMNECRQLILKTLREKTER